MPSSKPRKSGGETAPWRVAGGRYHALSHYLRREFGGRVWKVSVDAGFTCPNVDGTLGASGCVFCNIQSYTPPRSPGRPGVAQQIDEGIRRRRRASDADRFIAYFQPATNTYAPVERLRELWTEATEHAAIVGLIVGTRPDCVSDAVLDLLAEFSQRTWVSVEYGLQTIHEASLEWLGRGHDYETFLDAVGRSRQRALRIGAHVILGLPRETPDAMAATARELARLKIDSVKLHNLYVARDTALADMLAAGEVELPGRDEYARYVVDFLERLPPDCVIDRLSADPVPEHLVAPTWCLEKSAVRSAIEAELERRDTWQGRKCGGME